LLEHPGLAARLANLVGKPIDLMSSNEPVATPWPWPCAGGLKHHYETATSSEDVGKIATAANVKKLVLSHLSPDAVDPDLPEQLLQTARKSFSGEIVVGNDPMEI
jgi:phosphoribosyl 1,2-cyclic phosphodiesterase